MNLRDYRKREEHLLRAAPYADPAKVRLNLCAKVEAHMDNARCMFPEGDREKWRQFIAGEIHIVPRSSTALRLMEQVLLDSYSEYSEDHRRRAAYNEFDYYFFHTDSELGFIEEEVEEEDYDDYDDYEEEREDVPF